MKQKMYKLLSIVLTLSLVFTCCMVAFNATAEEAKEPITYYVSPDGVDADDRGLEPGTPLASVDKAVNLAKGLGYGAGETVYVKVIKVDDKIAYFNSDTSNELTPYEFTLDISSYDNANKASIGVQNLGFTVVGPIKFDNICLNLGHNNWGAFAIGNNDFYLGKNVSLSGGSSYDLVLGKKHNDPFTKDMTVYFGVKLKDIAQGAWNMPLYTNVSTFIYDNNASNTFNFATSQPRTTIYNGTINFIINDVLSFSLSTFSSKGGTYSFGVGKAVQLVNNGKGDISSAIACLDEMQDKEGNALPYYIYSNASGVANVMETTSTVGKIKVNLNPANYESIALVNDADESIKAEMDADGYITVTEPGKYTLKTKRSATYYVSPKGDDTAVGDYEHPLNSIDGAIKLANSEGYTSGDTVYVKLLKTTSLVDDIETEDYNKFHVTAPSAPYGLTSHKFKLKVSSYSDKAYLQMTNVSLGGPTAFENIELIWTGWTTFNLRAYDFSIASDVTYTSAYKCDRFVASWSISKVPDEVNYHLETLPKAFTFGGWNYITGFKNVNITTDKSFSGSFAFGDSKEDTPTVTYDGTINFNVKSASSVSFADAKGTRVFTENFATQIINSSGKAAVTTNFVDYFSGKNVKDTEKTVPYYAINNTYGADAIEFTKTAGKFKVNVDTNMYDVALVKDDDASVKCSEDNGHITLTKSGSYSLVLTKKPNLTVTYYVSPEGDDANNGKTTSKPFATLNAAITAANNAGYGKTDTVYLKVLHVAGKTTLWGGTEGVMTAHDYLLDISSLSDRATIGEEGHGLTIKGDVKFENITINADGTQYYDEKDGKWKDSYVKINLNGQNVTFGKNVFFSGYRWNAFVANGGTFDKDVNIYLGSYFQQNSGGGDKGLYIGGEWSMPKFDGDVNITVDNTRTNTLTIGSQFANPNATFNGNINFNIKNAAAVILNAGKSVYSTNTAIQIINSVNVDLAKTKTNIAALVDTAGNPLKTYIINNNTSNKDLIGFTSTAGTYTVNGLDEGEVLCIYNEVTKELIKTDAETFTVGVGEYSVWVENDTNADIDVDIRDLVYASENTNTTDANIIKRADIDGNGAVDAEDVKALCKILLGIIA